MPHDPAPAQKKTTTSTETTTLPLHHPGGQRRQNRDMNVRYAVCCGMQRGVVRGSLRSRECVQVQVCGEREIVEDRHLQLFERRYHLRGRLLAPATPDDVERARKLPGRAESPVAKRIALSWHPFDCRACKPVSEVKWFVSLMGHTAPDSRSQ